MTSPEPDCTAVEEQLSAFLDGELTSGAAAGALEHAFSCASCRAFFVAARRLQALAPELAEPPAAGAAPDAGSAADEPWRRIRAAAGLDRAPVRSRWAAAPGLRGLRAAALITLGLGGGYLLAAAGRPQPGAPAALTAPGLVTASAPAAAATMDERRFVALAQELLAADRKYQRTMLQVLRLVPALETGEGLDRPEERGFVRARNEEERPVRGAV